LGDPLTSVRRIPELPGAGRLGRHVRHDPRSLSYQVPEGDLAGLKSVRWARHIPVLDQGALGSCTGNAAEGCVGTSPLFEAIPDSDLNKPGAVPNVDEDQAIALYSAATSLDGYAGEYPPEDTGSDGLSVAKACVAAGLISGYRHATSLNAALTALASTPVITGVNWYDSFDSPAADGLITIKPGAQVRGGHEFVVDELDVAKQRIGFTNSWSESWGKSGRGYLSWADFGRLLSEQGDVTVFVPLTQPAPTPTPTPPGPVPADPLSELAALLRQFWTSVEGWLSKHGL
jgi:hypothetical protein